MIRWLKGALVSVLAVACNTATRVDYVHEPTKDLQDTYQIDGKELARFTKHGVVVYPFFKATEGTKSMVVVRMVSHDKQSVHFTSATLAGKDLELDKVVQMDTEPKPGVFRGAHVITKLQNAEIEKLAGGKSLDFEVTFAVGDAKPDTLHFEISRVETTQMVSH